jgi:hypothetical protein
VGELVVPQSTTQRRTERASASSTAPLSTPTPAAISASLRRRRSRAGQRLFPAAPVESSRALPPPQAVRGWARQPCRHFNNQYSFCLRACLPAGNRKRTCRRFGGE